MYPLDRGFLVVPKPSQYIRFVEISVVTFARVSSGATTTKTFEFKVSTTSGQEFTFSSIPKEEHEKLEAFCKSKNLHTRNDLAEETSYRVADLEESESEDEDFVEKKNESESDVNEEFNEDYDSDSNASQKSAGSDDGPIREVTDDVDDDEEDAEESSAAVPKRKGKSSERSPKKKAKREKKPGPKRPLTSFLYFSQAKRSAIKDLHPEFSLGETGKELGRLWKECSEEERKVILNLFSHLKNWQPKTRSDTIESSRNSRRLVSCRQELLLQRQNQHQNL